MDGDPNTTLGITDARLQMATASSRAISGTQVPAAAVNDSVAQAVVGTNGPSVGTGAIAEFRCKTASEKGTLSALAIAIIAGVVIVGSITAVSMVRHRQQVNEQKEAEQQKDAALAADRAKADELAKQAAAEPEAAMTPVDPNAAPRSARIAAAGPIAAGKTAAGNTALPQALQIQFPLTDKKSGAKVRPSWICKTQRARNSGDCIRFRAGAAGAFTTSAAGTESSAGSDDVNDAHHFNYDESFNAEFHGAAAPPTAPKQSDVVATADFAGFEGLTIATVPNSVGFIVTMDGKLFFQRSALADGQQDPKHDDDSIPPGTHQFHVITSQGGLQVSESNNVRFDFQAKKKLTLKIEVR